MRLTTKMSKIVILSGVLKISTQDSIRNVKTRTHHLKKTLSISSSNFHSGLKKYSVKPVSKTYWFRSFCQLI